MGAIICRIINYHKLFLFGGSCCKMHARVCVCVCDRVRGDGLLHVYGQAGPRYMCMQASIHVFTYMCV